MLDAVDAVLVRELQRDGRATFQALADRVGLSRTAVRARVQNLLDAGVVRVAGIAHAAIAGTRVIGHVSLTVDGPARPVADSIAARDAVRFVSLAAGPHAVVAEIRARDDDALSAELDAMRALPGVRQVEVFRSVSVVKDAYSVVRELDDVTLDSVDWRLLRELQNDGRTPYTHLAEVVGLSQAATRARVVRLMRSGAIQVTGLVDSSTLGTDERASAGLGVTDDVRGTAVKIAEMPRVNHVVVGFGRHDIVCGIDAVSRDGLVETIEALRAVPGVRVGESWYHLDIVKQSYTAGLIPPP